MTEVIVGVDVSKKTLEVAMLEKVSGKCLFTKTFPNTEIGFRELLTYVHLKRKGHKPTVVLEATGIYHENFVDFCYANNMPVCVMLPNKIKHFAKAENVKTKNDKVDAKLIARYGCAFHIDVWQPMSQNYFQLRSLSRQLQFFKKERTRIKSRMHALNTTDRTLDSILSLENEHLSFIDDAIVRLEEQILSLAQNDTEFYHRITNVATIKGVSPLTIIQVVCETNGFELFQSAKQLVSFAGLDVVEKQSGEYMGKSHISKKGNRHIRHLLYMPALSMATQGKSKLADFYNRLVARNNGTSKKKGIIAVERKLLVLIYSLWKSGETFDPNR